MKTANKKFKFTVEQKEFVRNRIRNVFDEEFEALEKMERTFSEMSEEQQKFVGKGLLHSIQKERDVRIILLKKIMKALK